MSRKLLYLSFTILYIVSIYLGFVKAERVTAKIPNYKQQKSENDIYNELMEKELKILKRQNKDIKYERPKFDQLNIDDKTDLDQKLRILQENLTENESSNKRETNTNMNIQDLQDLNIPLLNIQNPSCDKTMNFNKDENHVYNNLSSEEQLKQVQQELQATKNSQIKSNRDILIDNLKNNHQECYFGMTIANNSIAYKTYESYCKKQKEMKKDIIFNNKQFQVKIKGSHIKVHEILPKYHTNHTITCGVQPIQITHDTSNTLTQYISFICFDPKNNDNSASQSENQFEQSEEIEQQQKQHTDL